MSSIRAVIVVLATAIAAGLPAGTAMSAEPVFPELTGRIVDNAHLLKPEDKAAIEAELKALEEKSTDQVVVLTVPTLQNYPIEDYGYRLGRKWGIGQKGKDNGVILIVAPNERKVRIEVGLRLEPLMTDAMSKLIIDRTIVPTFRRGDFSGGIRAGVTDIKDVLLGDAEEVKKRARVGKAPLTIDYDSLIVLAIFVAIVIFSIRAHMREAAQTPQTLGRDDPRYRNARNRRRYGGGPIIIPGGSSNWGGGWSSGDSGGGGFSGGGGGASGDW